MDMGRSNQQTLAETPHLSIDRVTTKLSITDLNDLCDATDAAIEQGGGFGWVTLPARETLERYWQGVTIMPQRDVFVARLDGTICGTIQMIKNHVNNEAQTHAVQMTTHFVTPWARGHGLAKMLILRAEQQARSLGKTVINLDVRETLEAAIQLYESLGYEHYGSHPAYAYIDGHYVGGRYYMKILDKI